MSKRKAIQKTFEFFIDLWSLAIANILSFIICAFIDRLPVISVHAFSIYAFSLFISFCVIFFGFASPLNLTKRGRLRETLSVLRNCLLIYMTHAVMLVLIRSDLIYGRSLFILSLILFIVFSAFNRYILKRVLIYKFSNSKMARLVGVITVSERSEDFLEKFETDWMRKIKGVALLDAKFENNVYKYRYHEKQADENGNITVMASEEYETVREISGVPVVANMDNFIEWVRSASIDEVFINLPYNYQHDMKKSIEEIESMGITVHINLPSLENIVEESEFDNVECAMFGGYPTATLSASEPLSLTMSFLKRLMDIAGGLAGLLISLPIIAITAIPLLIESPGPLIFKQPRVGKNGRIFNIYKLRSMYVDAEERKKELMDENKMEGLMFKMDNDPRITKVGKFIRKTSIDELPQFWNVLKGDMSLVGTRPPTVDEFEQYESHHKRRLSMRPGITGMWQVCGRSDIQNFEEVVKLDVKYIDNWSLWLDIKILLKTFGVVLRGSGAE